MKKVEKVASGANFAAVTVGKTEELNQYALPLAPGVEIPGKVFVGGDLQATGAEMSFQQFAPGGSVGSSTPTRPTKNFTSSSAETGSSRSTGRSSP